MGLSPVAVTKSLMLLREDFMTLSRCQKWYQKSSDWAKINWRRYCRFQFCHEEYIGTRGHILMQQCSDWWHPRKLSETCENCKQKVTKNIKNKLDITDDIEIDRCHRMDKFQRNKSKLKTVVCKLFSFKDKHKVLQNVKKHRNLHLRTFF